MQVLGKQGTNRMVNDLFRWARLHLVNLLQSEYSRCAVYVTKAASLNENIARGKKERYSRILLKKPYHTIYGQSHKYVTCLLYQIQSKNKTCKNQFGLTTKLNTI